MTDKKLKQLEMELDEIHDLMEKLSGISSMTREPDYESKYGKEAVRRYKEMKSMTIEEFMKSEFYRDILKG